MARLESFLAIEGAVQSAAMQGFKPIAEEIEDKLTVALEAEDFGAAEDIVDKITLNPMLDEVRDEMEFLFVTALLLGVSQVTSDVKQSSFMETALPPVLNASVNQFMVGIQNASADALKKGLSKLVNQEQSLATLVDKADAEVLDLARRINAAVSGRGKALFDAGANMTTSRLVSFGFLSEATAAGQTTYQITEVLDGRTCAVCRRMHGKTFTVMEPLVRIEQQLLLQDPAEMKAAFPFPKTSKAGLRELDGLSPKEIAERGWDAPPYHPRCRGIMQVTGTVRPLTGGARTLADPISGLKPVIPDEPGLAAAPAVVEEKVITATIADFEELSLSARGSKVLSQEVVEEWNRAVGARPKDFFSRVFEGTGLDLAEVQIQRSGSLTPGIKSRLKIQGKLRRQGKDVGILTRVIETADDGSKKALHEVFTLSSDQQGTSIAKKILGNSMIEYERMGVASIELNANIDVGGYAWAKYGFKPTRESWVSLRPEVKKRFDVLFEMMEVEATAGRKSITKLVDDILGADNPERIWELVDMSIELEDKLAIMGPSGKVSLGKRLLLGTDWGGVLSLSDSRAVARFNRYVGR